MFSDLISEFNHYFEGDAKAETINGQLSITVGSRTVIISLPAIIGVQCEVVRD
ncbi:hypothetical protein ACFLVL_02995 [Chloroflexota bacterium]